VGVIKEHASDENGKLYLPQSAESYRMTEGTEECRPVDLSELHHAHGFLSELGREISIGSTRRYAHAMRA
jgi:hypothetical protein